MRRAAALTAGALALAGAPAGANGQVHDPGRAPAASARAVGMTDSTVLPTDLVVAPGASVTWTNLGRRVHSVTSDDRGETFDSGTMVPGGRFTVTAPAKPGVVTYRCSFHSFIRGRLIVSRLTLTAPHAVVHGAAATVTGTAPDTPVGTTVRLERRAADAWVTVAEGSIRTGGTFRLATPALTSRAVLRAVVGDAVSPAARVPVRARVTAVRSGATLRVAVRPAGPRTRAHLQRLDLDTYRWHDAGEVRLTAGRGRVGLPGAGVWRVSAGRVVAGVEGGSSRPVPYRGLRAAG